MVKTTLIVFSWFNKRIVFRRKALNQKSSQSIFNPSKNIYHSISLFPFSLPQIKIRKKTSTTCLKKIKKLHSNVKKKKKKEATRRKSPNDVEDLHTLAIKWYRLVHENNEGDWQQFKSLPASIVSRNPFNGRGFWPFSSLASPALDHHRPCVSTNVSVLTNNWRAVQVVPLSVRTDTLENSRPYLRRAFSSNTGVKAHLCNT